MIILQVSMYLITSNKGYFFYPLVIPVAIYLINRSKYVLYSMIGVNVITLVSAILYIAKINTLLPSMIINRTLFLPAQISFQYHEYFSKNDLVLLSHSIFENFFAKPIHSDHPISIIGSKYYTNNWPNTGYLGDGFMNFGYVGMLVFSIIFAGILILCDSLSNTKGKSMITSAYMVLFMLSFNNIALLTNLLFGGMLFYLLLIFLYKDNITFDNYCDSGKI